jgi:membrane associated rhomboid family serine protease
MIPLKDDTPRLTTPVLTYLLIGTNLLAFLYELSLGRRAQGRFLEAFALIPAHLLSAVHHAVSHSHGHAHAAPLWVGLLPILTSMFLHAGWLHLIFNMWFLWVFGRNLEDGLGHVPYLVFYLTCGVAAAVAQTIATPSSVIPTLGASGAIAGVMGGYFVRYPRARVLMLVPFFFIFFVWLPAWVVLGYWFVLQFLSGVGSTLLGPEIGGGIAFWAHVGGFLAGVLLVRLFPLRTRRYYYGD